MALKPCRECNKKVSTEASTCPSCGVPNPMAWCKKNKIKVSRPNDLFPILERLGGVNIGQCEMTKARSGGGTSRHKLTMWVMRNHKKFDGKSNREIGQIWMDDYLSVDDGINLFDDATSNSNYKDRGNH